MAVYDDQQTKTRPEEIEADKLDKRTGDLNQITGINPAEEQAMEDRAVTDDMAERAKLDEKTGDSDDEIPFRDDEKKKKSRSRVTKKQVVIGSIVGTVIGGGLGALTILTTGPMQVFQLDAALGKHESAHTNIINRRINRMLYRSLFKNADDRVMLSRSRLGTVQNRVFGGMLDRLDQQHGIKLTETTGRVTGNSRVTVTFDPPANSPLRGPTPTHTRLNIARAFGIDAEKVRVGTIGNTDTSLSFRLSDFKGSELDNIKKGLAHHAGGGRATVRLNPKVAVSMNKRLFSKTLRLPSLFHPVSRASESVGRRIDNAVLARRERKQADAERSRKSVEVDQRRSSARSDLRSKAGSGLMKTAGAAVAIQGVMCTVKDIAGIVPGVYYATIVTPAMIRSIQTQSAASQFQSGQNLTAQLAGDVIADFRDADGRSVWGAKSVNALTNGGSGVGTDIDIGARSAFTTTGSSISGLVSALGYDGATAADVADGVSDFACNPVARVVGLAAGATLTVAGVVGGVVTGGTTTAGAVGRVAAQAVLAGTISYAASRILGEVVEGQVRGRVTDVCGVEFDSGESDKPEDIEVLNAEAYGNCLAYAARMSSNINAAAMGGVPLSSGDETALLNQINEQEIAEFRQKDLFDRLFNPQEKRSLAMATMRPALSHGLVGVGNSFGSIVPGLLKSPISTVSNLLSIASPSAHAQSATYDWGFPLVSMPASIVDDPNYDSPENVKWVIDNRGSIDEDRVKNCFGVEIVGEGSQLRTTLLDKEINPLSNEYNGANCGDLSPDWIRTALFVMDDSIARTMDCYDDNAQACTELGLGTQPANTNTSGSLDTSQCPSAPVGREEITDVQGILVHNCIAGTIERLVNDAKASGITFTGGGWRDPARQIALRRQNCGTSNYAIYEMSANSCSPPTAKPGTSFHERGLAIDLICNGIGFINLRERPSTRVCWDWLVANAASYGLKNLPSENWHWSTTGN